RPHPVDARHLRLPPRPARPRNLGDPDRDRGLPDPRLPAAAPRPAPQAEAQMITIQWAYSLAGLMFGAFAIFSAFDRANRKRFGNAAFWGLMAVSLIAGSWLGEFVNGLLVLALALIGGFNLMGRGDPATTNEGERLTWAHQLGNR